MEKGLYSLMGCKRKNSILGRLNKIWLSGQEMQAFIKENDNEAMYFTPDMQVLHPKKEFQYLVGLDKHGKNSIVFDIRRL